MRVPLPRVRVRVGRSRLAVGRARSAETDPRREQLRLTGRESLLVLAPHCDDETLGAGSLLAEAVRLGCRVSVAVVTNGDGFRYAAGRHYKRLRLSCARHVEFAYLRQRETRRAMADLGLDSHQLVFLGYPDRGLQVLWNDAWDRDQPYRSPFTGADHSPYHNSYTPHAPHCGRAVVDDIKGLIRCAQPTHLVIPHPRDAHGDHTATFCFAMHALEELCEEGMALETCILAYLIHRGVWPVPRGFDPYLELHPPASFAELGDRWVFFTPSAPSLSSKHKAVLRYRSQLSLLPRFLLSFVRRNELFSLYAPHIVRSVQAGTVMIDGSAHEWPHGVGHLPDPVRDTVTRNVNRGGDIRSIAVCADAGHLYLRFHMYGKLSDEVACIVRIAGCSADRHKMDLSLVIPDRVRMRSGHQWVSSQQVVCRGSGRVMEVAVPRSLIGDATRVIFGAETRYRRILVDRTGWELLLLPPGTEHSPYVFSTASLSDLPAVAETFAAAFPEDVERALGSESHSTMILHLFQLLYAAESRALLVARGPQGVVGYVYAPTSLRNIWHTAISGGHLWRWFTNWVRRRYRLRMGAALRILVDKYVFVFSALRDRDRVEHRILSVGVRPDHRGQGLATVLVQQALNRFQRLGAQKVRLEVRPQNVPALVIYERLGFKVCSTLRDTRGEWWVMLKDLAEQGPESST